MLVKVTAARPEPSAELSGIGVVGLGYWGPNLLRTLHELRCSPRIVACDVDAQSLMRVERLHREVEVSARFDDLLKDPEIEAVVIATPASTHFTIAKQALTAGKAVLVEKPLATSFADGAELVRIARERKSVLMVGHIFEYSRTIAKVADIVRSGELGEIVHINSVRASLGLLHHDVNVVWDLATHDVSIAMRLMGGMPTAVGCQGQSHCRCGVEDVAMLTLRFPTNVIVFIHVSWLGALKTRRATIVGSKKTLLFDDAAVHDNIRLYDRVVAPNPLDGDYGKFRRSERQKEIAPARLQESRPLDVECRHFVDCVLTGSTPRTDGLSALRAVSVLEAANLSLRQRGAMVPIRPADV